MSLTYAPALTHPRPPASQSRQVTKVLSGTTPEQLTNERILCTRIRAMGTKGNNTANSAPVYLGQSSTNQTQNIPVSTGVTIEAPPGQWLDLSQFYLRGTSGDGVVVDADTGSMV